MLNVGHGDSIVVRAQSDNETVFGIVDSNWNGAGEPRGLQKLRELGAEQLSFIVLTHPHDDHYRGLLRVLEEYRGRVARLYTFPISPFLNGKRKETFADLFESVIAKTDGQIKASLAEFLGFLVEADEQCNRGELQWDELTGPMNRLAPPGFQGHRVEAILPLPKFKGDFYQLLDLKRVAAIRGDVPNSMSIVLRITSHGVAVTLGAYATHQSWFEHRRQMSGHEPPPRARVVKIPHHGSKHDVREDTLPYYFESATEDTARFGLISADGRRHPHPEVLSLLQSDGIKPYCTNLARVCGARKVDKMFTAADIPRAVVRLINSGDVEVPAETRQPCQGEVHVRVLPTGVVEVEPQYRHPCGFRGDYDNLALL